MPLSFIRTYNFLLLLIFLHSSLYAQGLKGTVKNTRGEVLSNASIFVPELNSSSSANVQGDYAIKLANGKYTVLISFIGYKTQKLEVEISGSWLTRDVVLSDQGYVLKETMIGSSREDFAYTIMRNAIAKKKFHLMQCDSYEMRTYTKGTGGLINVPFLVRRKLAKEGVKEGQAYTSETVSQIKFTRPNKIEEKVISVRTHGENPNPSASPTMFVNQSFYNDKIGGNTSPLAKSAFAHYRFKYLGSFEEGDLTIYKIAVIPRSRGDNIFEGTIYIIDDYWAIKGLELKTSQMGFPIKVKQQYAEVAKAVWLPITHHYTFSGKVFGFEGEFKYLVSCSNFKVEINEDLVPDQVKELVKVPDGITPASKNEAAALIQNGAKLSRKHYIKALEKYEKESRKEVKEPQVVSERNFNVDKLAGKRDSAYWDTIRPVPLTDKEQIGYHRQDSIADKQAAKVKRDSVSGKAVHKFGLKDLFLGDNFRFSKRTTFALSPTVSQINYNTVEGLAVNLKGSLNYRKDSLRSLRFDPALRYCFASETWYAKARLTYRQKIGASQNFWHLEGGQFVEQFNSEDPIVPVINTISTLLYRRNFMKIYQKQYASARYEYLPSSFFKLNTSIEWAQRNELVNHSDYSFFYNDRRVFSSNIPFNNELGSASFPQNQALVLSTSVSYRPIQRYRTYNNRKIPLVSESPEVILTYKKGINSLLSSDIDFDLVQLGLNHTLNVGAGDKFTFEFKAGSFLNNRKMYFMDYHHFDANRTALTSIKPAGSFRLLDYYLYSTNNEYFSGHTHYSFRKFLFTRVPEVRFAGLKEALFLNYLKTRESPHYYELGYSLDNVFRFFRLEAATSFVNGKYDDFGLRLGISTAFKIGGR